MRIRPYEARDWSELLRLVRSLFPEWQDDDEADLRASLMKTTAQVLVLERESEGLAGYVEVGQRSVVDGCVTSPVAYIEAWYVDEDVRRSGHGRALLEAAEEWARDRGFHEMGSDALLENGVSHAAHRASGYVEVDRVIGYRKALSTPVSPTHVRQVVPFFFVNDIEASLRFYMGGLGFVKTREWVPGGKLEWCWLELGDSALMLQEIRPERRDFFAARGPKGNGVSLNFICTDAVAMYRDMMAKGLQAKRPFVGNGMWVTEIIDPDGYVLYFESVTQDPEEMVLPE
jgi:GNAT superfamily N-acetyltransferase